MSSIAGGQGSVLQEVIKTLVVIVIGLLIGMVIVLFISEEPTKVFDAILTGPLPSASTLDDGTVRWRGMTRFGTFLEDSITLALVGLAVAIPFRAQQFSLGADGQMFLGALASAVVSIYLPLPGIVLIPLAFLAAVIAGFAWGWLPGVMKARAGANEIVTTLMLNVIAIQFFIYCVTFLMLDRQAGFIVTPFFQDAAILNPLIHRTNVTWMIAVAPLVCLLAYLFLSRTNMGYELRVVGQNPAFGRRMGMPVDRTVALSMALGGAAAGMAGFHIANAILKRLPSDFPAGLGFEGIVVALLARNDPRLILPAALFYGYLRAGAQVMERTTDVSREMVLVVQAIIILLIVSENLLPRLGQWIGLGRSAR
ncbi:ABC transporter permease [Yoonia litorea]|uniref:Nucleoside ABC transporter membrane protein n=1 Tax=Yoonia litorea TaxID=1123755 RepID=A0A1I6MDX1_9RHOB|nr:ABC transporter permease [Yoonia litorea]SFS13905.1 nucleoside ABC transporter membrane protein [Yoonia litorea]